MRLVLFRVKIAGARTSLRTNPPMSTSRNVILAVRVTRRISAGTKTMDYLDILSCWAIRLQARPVPTRLLRALRYVHPPTLVQDPNCIKRALRHHLPPQLQMWPSTQSPARLKQLRSASRVQPPPPTVHRQTRTEAVLG